MTRKEAFEKARDVMADAGLRGIESNYPGEISSVSAPPRRDSARTDD